MLRRIVRNLGAGFWEIQSGKPRKSWERKRSKRLKGQQPERKEKYRERHYRANPKQHHKLSKPSAKPCLTGLPRSRASASHRQLSQSTSMFSSARH
jgi:hypothetical protein